MENNIFQHNFHCSSGDRSHMSYLVRCEIPPHNFHLTPSPHLLPILNPRKPTRYLFSCMSLNTQAWYLFSLSTSSLDVASTLRRDPRLPLST